MKLSSTGVSHVPHNQRVGSAGEAFAAEYLSSIGFVVLERNWRCRAGEIDLIARDDTAYVAVEVKTRTSVRYGHPFEAITALKLARLRRLLLEWATQRQLRSSPLRVDAIGITLRPGAEPTLEHLRGLS